MPANLGPFIFGPSIANASVDPRARCRPIPTWRLLNPGTTKIDGSTVLVQEDDTLEDEVLTLYFDAIFDVTDSLNITNKSFFESLDNLNENAYGFSQLADTWAFEDQFIVTYSMPAMDWFQGNFQLSPSVRHQDFEHGDNFFNEYFDRRDITQPGSPIDRRAHGDARARAVLEPHGGQVHGLRNGVPGRLHVLRRSEPHCRCALRLHRHGVAAPCRHRGRRLAEVHGQRRRHIMVREPVVSTAVRHASVRDRGTSSRR